ncbi:MAG: SdrD B-like domain-containing protein [Eubacteriales bacterium]
MKKNSEFQLQSTHTGSLLHFPVLKKRKAWLALFVLFTFILNSIAIPLPVRAAADDFTITKAVDKSEVFAGENFTYTISYANSNSDATNAVVTDVLPSNVVYVSSEGSTQVSSIEKTGTPGNETVIFHFANPLPSGSTGILKITVKFPEGTTLGGAANTASNTAVISSDPADDKIPKTSNAVTVIPKVNPPDWSVTKAKVIPVVTPAIGQPVTYQITVHGNSVVGGLNMENVIITDTIPTNATYVSSSDGGVYDPLTGIITFPVIASLGVGQAITRQVVLIYNAPVTISDTATNTTSVTGTPLGAVTGPVSLGPVTVTHGFAAANFTVGDFSKSARQENDRYSIGQEAVFNLGNIANTGNVPMDSFVVVDSIPDIITLNSITAGSYNQAANAVISYQTNLNASYRVWTTLTSPSNQTLLVADLPLLAGEWVTQVRWEITGSTPTDGIVPGFCIQNPLTLKATVVDPTSADITNNATLTAYRGIDTPIVKTASKTIYVIGQMPWLVPEKTVHAAGSSTYTSTTSANMNGTLYFRLRIQNHPFATGNYIDPVAVDVLPSSLENITYTGYSLSSGSVVMSAPVVSAISGNRWAYNFTGVLTPGDYIDIFYTATIKDLTTVGLYDNELYISTLDNAAGYQNSLSDQLTDTTDWDSDGVFTDRFIKSDATYFVNFSGSLTSHKWMKGSQDADWVTTGSTLPGGIANYQITIGNSGSNGPISNIVAIDQLPAIGDKTVLGGASRLSEWRPYLVNQITYKIFDTDGTTEIFPAGALIHIYYSTSGVVSTAELSNPVSGVPDASWSLTPPADITTVRAVKFTFTGFGLEKNQKIVVEWPMRAPYDAPPDLDAYNSFAYGATYPGYVNNVLVNTPFLPAEPNKVDFIVHDPAGHTFNIGNFVWEDSNKNGIQDAGEKGINGILVNLYDSFGNLVSYTRTGDSQGSLPGYYLFPNVPAANGYYLEFIYPQNYQATDYQTGNGANASTDSDIVAASRTVVTDLGVSKYSVKTAPFNVTAADDLTIDAGLYQYASLGDRVWNDKNTDGIQNAGESGIAGITVELLDGAGALLASTTTNGSGLYSFADLDPGTYQVRFTNPSGNYKFSLPGIGSDRTIDSDGAASGDELTATSGLITLTTGQVDLTVDQGMYLGRVGDFVFADTNANGIWTSGEAGFAGVVVKLYTSAGVLVGTSASTTTANPNYLFDNLNPGIYYITIQPPAGAKVTLMDVGANDAIDSDVDKTTLRSADFTLARGERNLTIDVGLYYLASLGNLVWYDQNGDGIYNGAETGLAGVSVGLLNADGSQALYDDGTPVTAKSTNASGAYSFTGLRPGDYKVKFDLPSAEYIFSPQNVGGAGANNNSDPNILTGITNTITLASGAANNNIDAGMHKGMIGDYVWQDMNANGIQNAGEPGMGAVTVDLYKVGTAGIFATTTSDSNGYYSFTQLDAGEYYLQFTAGGVIWFATPQTAAGSTTSNDSNVDITGLTSHITQNAGDINLSIDAGYYQKASVGDRIWNDINGNGVQDAGELGIPNVKVTLTYPDSSTVFVLTDANGNYSFSNLIPGNYTVSIDSTTLPANYQQSFEKDGSRNGSVAVVLNSGSAVTDVDFGYYVKSSIGDFVWQDTNANGIQDAGEPGLPGVTVSLYNNNGIEIATTTTDANGNYLFPDLLVGTYTVGVTVQQGWVISPYLAGADRSVDSNIQVGTGISAGIAVLGGENITNVDAGLYQKASVGDRVWNDINGDGVQDAGEAGIPNVKVILTYPDNSTVSTITDANGYYLFSNLNPGNYTLSIDPTTLPANYQQTYEKDGSLGGSVPVTLISNSVVTDVDFGYYVKSSIGDFVWQDTNANGIQDAGEPGLPGVTVTLYNYAGTEIAATTTDSNGQYLFPDLLVGTYTVGITVPADSFISPYQAGSDSAKDSDVHVGTGLSAGIAVLGGENITDIDAGLYQKASVGDRIWNDINSDGIQDAGEAGIPNVKVTLTYPDSATVSVLTDANGNYSFSNLIPGNYTVSIDSTTLPANYQQSFEKDGSRNGSVAVVLNSGSAVTDVDFGYYVKSSIGDFVWQDTNANGIQDAGEPGLPGVTVSLYNNNGIEIATTTTDANGNYLFPDLLVGTYTVGVTVQPGWVISPYLAGADRSVDSNIQVGTGISAGIAVLGGEHITNVDAGLYQFAQIGTPSGMILTVMVFRMN